MKCSIKLLSVIVFLYVNFLFAQQRNNVVSETNYRAVHWSTNDGLTEGSANWMIKDINGFLWIGTEGGLSRFDGSRFKNYYYDAQKSGTISGKNIDGFVEDSLHNIWIGTEKGLSRYDIKADTFANFLPAIKNSFDEDIVPFRADKNSVYCIERYSIITSYNIHSFKESVLAKLPAGSSIIRPAYSVYDVKTNSVWILKLGPQDGHTPGGGLLNVSLSTGKAQDYNWACFKKISNHSHVAEGMCFDDKRKSIWINSNDGLLEFSLINKKFYHITAIDSLNNLKNYSKNFDLWHWIGIDIDTQGRVWLATVQKGIVIYNPADGSAKTLLNHSDSLQQEISDYNACLYCDRDGMVWSGFWMRKGIYQVIPFAPAVTRYTTNTSGLSHENVFNIINGENNTLWMGTSNGLDIFNPHTNTFEVLHEKDFLGIKIKPERIIPIYVDTTVGKAWLIADKFIEMEIANHRCRQIQFKDSLGKDLNDATYGFIYPFAHGCITTATYNNTQGVFIIKSDSAIAHEILSFPFHTVDENFTTSNGDNLIFIKRPDNLGNQTYLYQHNKCVRIHTPLDSLSWTTVYRNTADSHYWVIAGKQLLHYNKDFHLIHVYKPEDGLPDIDIYSLIADKRGNIWFNTDRSIHQLNVKTGVISALSEKDGFQPQNFTPISAIAMDGDGSLYFPGEIYGKGFDKINPDKYTYTPAFVYLQSLEINQKAFPLSASVNNLQQLSLKYFENTITIETGVIDFYAKGTGHIRYKLEGLNDAWQYAPSYYTIRYDGLPAKKYKLVIQASNAGNEFNGPEKILLIDIAPAIWNTWLFRTIAALSLIALIYLIIRWRVRERYKVRLERSEKQKQLAELKDKASRLEMETLRSQMNPHFIFNCLSSINSFILKSKTEEASKYLTKFSRLIRMVLNNSKQPFISLEDELETLRLYLDMERLRFKNSFEYRFNFKNTVEVENIFIPPLLLQPFAENAIWHGLMHKQEKGFLNFDFSIEEKILLCIITDNGVGREQAELLKSKSAEKQKSLGLKITTERLSLLNNSSNEHAFFTIEDSKDEIGNVSGTRVQLKIYYKMLNEI